MRRSQAALAVARAAHHIERPFQDWLEGVAAPLSHLLGVGMGAVVVPFGRFGRLAPVPPFVASPSGDLGVEIVTSYFERLQRLSGPGQYARILRRSFVVDRPVKLLSSTLGHDEVGICRASVRHAMGHAYDHVGLTLSDGAAGGLSISSVSDPDEPLGSADAALLSSMVAMLGRHLALRRALGSEVASIDPDGTVRHLDRSFADAASRLRALVKRAERGRRDRETTDLDVAMQAWGGLFEGTWTLMDRFDEDGRRRWVVYRCADDLAPLRALSMPERRVLVLRLRGWRPKSIAQRLDVPVSSVQTWLASARYKLGGLSWRDLAVLFAELPPDRVISELTDLSPEEPP